MSPIGYSGPFSHYSAGRSPDFLCSRSRSLLPECDPISHCQPLMKHCTINYGAVLHHTRRYAEWTVGIYRQDKIYIIFQRYTLGWEMIHARCVIYNKLIVDPLLLNKEQTFYHFITP